MCFGLWHKGVNILEPDEDGVVVPVSDQPSGQGGDAKLPESDDKVDVNASHDSKAASGTSSVSSDPPENDGESKNTDSEKPKEPKKDPPKDPPKDDDSGGGKPPAVSPKAGSTTNAHDNDDDDDDQPIGGGDSTSSPQRPLRPDRRVRLIKLKLIDQHDDEKKANRDYRLDEAHFKIGKKESATAGNADKFSDGLGYLGIASGIAGNISSMVDNDDAKEAAGITSAVGGGIGFLTSGMKSLTGMYRAGRTKSRYASKIANTKVASGAVGMIGNAFGMMGSFIGLFNDAPQGTKADLDAGKAAGGAGIFKGVMDAIGSGLDFKASKDEKNAHSEIGANAAAISSGMSLRSGRVRRDLDQELNDARGNIATLKSLRRNSSQQFDLDALKTARKRRHTLKARKDAMKQAADMHRARAGESQKNVGNLVGGILGGIGSIMSGVSKILGKGGGLLGNILKYGGAGVSLIGNLSKGIGKAVDAKKASNEKEALKPKKRDIVDEYIGEKAGRIMDEARNIRLSDPEKSEYGVQTFPMPTLDEAKKIAVLRLGVTDDTRISVMGDDDLDLNLSSEDYEKAFKIITEKRAKNILKSEDADKNEMLDALGLSHDASLEDVKSALSGDIR